MIFDINLIFQIINLGIIIYLISRFVSKNAIPDIKEQLNQEKMLENDFKDNIKDLKNAQDQVKLDIANQDSLCRDLTQKMLEWKSKVAAEEEQNLKEQEIIKIALQEKLNYQAEQVAIKKAEMRLMPIVHKELLNYAESHFKNEIHQKDYIHGILHYLDKHR